MEIESPLETNILILGDEPDEYSARSRKPFAGDSGRALNAILSQASLARVQCSIGYIAQDRSLAGRYETFFVNGKKDSKGMMVTASLTFPKPQMQEYLERLRTWITKFKPNIIIALGASTMMTLTGESKLDDFRGTILKTRLFGAAEGHKEIKVVPTYDLERLRWERHQSLVMTWDFRKAITNSEDPKFPEDKRVLVPKATVPEFIEYCQWIIQVDNIDHKCNSGVEEHEWTIKYPYADEIISGVALDIENTYGSAEHPPHITQFGIGHSENYAMTIQILNGTRSLLTESEELEVWKWIAKLAKCSHIKWIMQNAPHDISVLWMNQKILFPCYFDTMLAAQLLWPELRKGLGFLSSICLNVPAWKHVSGESTYNPEDVANTKGVFNVLSTALQSRGLEEIFTLEMKEVPIAIMMGLQGVKIDKEEKARLLKEYTQLNDDVNKTLGNLTKQYGVINWNSPAQVKKLLYHDLGLPAQYKRRKSVKDDRKETTDAEALTKLCQKTNSLVPRLLLKSRTLKKALSSYLDFAVSPQGTVHTSYKIGSATEIKKLKLGQEDNKSLGRWSSSSSIILPFGSGNLQSIPEYARSMYVPFDQEKNEIGCADFMQAEAVVVAYLSNDEILIDAIKRGSRLRDELRYFYKIIRGDHDLNLGESEYVQSAIDEITFELSKVDIHRLKAAEVFNIPVEEVTKQQRTIGKVLRHESNYDGGPKVLQAQLAKLDLHYEIGFCKQMLLNDKALNPSKSNWHVAIKEELSLSGRELSNPFGRYRRFLASWDEDLWKRAYAFKPQSTVGDLLNSSMLNFYEKWGDQVRILLQLHDGLYIEYPKNERLLWLTRLRNCMLTSIEINHIQVTIDVDCKAGPNWKESEEVFV